MDRALGLLPEFYRWNYDQVKNLAIRIDNKNYDSLERYKELARHGEKPQDLRLAE
jgi:hypothetical protein